MSDAFYTAIRTICYGPWILSASPVVLNAERTNRRDAYLIAANHTSPYDVPIVIAHARRRIDFVSITEVFEHPLSAWFLGSMNAFPLDRSRPDAPTVRTLLSRLKTGRAVCMFPEGQFRDETNSMLSGGPIRPGLGRISLIARAPVIPCVIRNSTAYNRWTAWPPIRRTRYGIAFGELMPPPRRKDQTESFEADYQARMLTLASELDAAMSG